MMALRFTAGSLAMLSLLARGVFSDCESFGMDFQNSGSYFQNSLSTDNFTFVSQFEGCETDAVAFNYIIDPDGDQTQCSNTPMTPDDVNEMATCPLLKDQLFSGAWSIIILSNNGEDGAPVAYERDFSLSVGAQSTTTVTPTVTATTVSVPMYNITSTTTYTVSTTLPTSTVTVASTTVQRTVTSTPKAVTITSDIYLATIVIPKYTLAISKSVVTHTASCKLPVRQATADPTAQVKITTGSGTSVATATSTGQSAKFRMLRDTDPRPDTDLKRFLREREERLASQGELAKRAPDPQPLVVTDTNTADWKTVYTTSIAATSTLTVFSTTTVTQTITPSPVTVMSGATVLAPKTVTAATPTKTKYDIGIDVIFSTKTQHLTYTITTTTTPTAVKTACMHSGGVLYKGR